MEDRGYVFIWYLFFIFVYIRKGNLILLIVYILFWCVLIDIIY